MADEQLTTRKVQVVTTLGLGRCLAAACDILPGEVIISEAPLLLAAPRPGTDEEQGDVDVVLRAFCAAPPDVQKACVETLASIDVDQESHMTLEARKDAQEALDSPWAAGHTVESLQAALLAFNLNAHRYANIGSAIYPTMRFTQHSCEPNAVHSAQPDVGRGGLCAIRAIQAGESISIGYHDPVPGRRRRQLLLQRKKQFFCGCSRCCGPDWSSQVPCPGCHPRGPDGFLPTGDGDGDEGDDLFSLEAHAARRVHYARRDAVCVDASSANQGDGWQCEHCKRRWTSEQMFPTLDSAGGNPLGTSLEARLESLVEALGARLSAYGPVAGVGTVLGEGLSATRSALGMRHWATAKMIHLQSQWLLHQVEHEDNDEDDDDEEEGEEAQSTHAPDRIDVDNALAKLIDNEEWLWHFCAESGAPPHAFGLTTGRLILLAIQRVPPPVKRRMALHALVINPEPTVAGLRARDPHEMRCGRDDELPHDSSVPALLAHLDAPPTYGGATNVLLEAAEAELHAGALRSALLYYKRAHLYAPHSTEIPACIAATQELLG